MLRSSGASSPITSPTTRYRSQSENEFTPSSSPLAMHQGSNQPWTNRARSPSRRFDSFSSTSPSALTYDPARSAPSVLSFQDASTTVTPFMAHADRVEEDRSNCLQVGDVISLFYESNVSHSGFLISEGFFERSCKIEKSESFTNVNLKNFYDTLFLVEAVADDVRDLLEEDLDDTDSSNEILCYCCTRECDDLYYRCDRQPVVCNLCPKCFEEENYPVNITQSDFEKKQGTRKKINHVGIKTPGELVHYGQAVQLKHISSGLLLSFKTSSDRSSKESLQLFLGEVEQDSLFTILPCYSRLQQHGERVSYGDEVKLLSVKWESVQTGFMIDEIARNSKVNIAWKVIPFSRVMHTHPLHSQITSNNQHVVKGGSIVRLYHLEAGGFLSNDTLDYETRQVFVKISAKEIRKIKDSNTLWRIVLPSSLEDGGRILSYQKDQFRLQHCGTGKYLSLLKEKVNGVKIRKPVMVDNTDNSTLWMFRCLPERDGQVNAFAKAYLFHVERKAWLHCEVNAMHLQSNKTTSLISNLHPIKANSVSFTKKHLVADALVVGVVEPFEVRGVLHLKEMSRYLELFIEKLSSGNVTLSESNTMIAVLKDMIKFVILTTDRNMFTAEGFPVRTRQRLFRAQLIIRHLFEILKASQQKKLSKPIPLYEDICLLIQKLLAHVVKSYHKNALIVFEYIEFLKNELLEKHKDEHLQEILKTIQCIYEDNHYVLVDHTEFLPSLIHTLLKLAEKDKKTRYLNLLSALCTCNKECVSKNQDMICNLLMDSYQSVIIPTKLENNVVMVFVEGSWIKIKKFCKTNSVMLEYYTELLRLFSNICVGRNYNSIMKLSTLLPYPTIMAALSNSKLPALLRSQYCDLLLNLYVNAHPQQFINLVHYSRFWNDLSGKRYQEQQQIKQATKKGTKSKNANPDTVEINWNALKHFMKDYLEHYKDGDSKLTLAIITLCKYLVAFGLLDEEEINHFFTSLYKILEDRGNELDEYLLAAKLQLCEILDMLTDRQLDHRMNKFLETFKQLQLERDGHLTMHSVQKLDQDLFTLQTKQGEVIKLNSQVSLDNIVYLTKLAHPQVNVAAYRILFRHYTHKEELRSFISKSHLLVSDASMTLYERTRKTLQELRKALAGNIKNNTVRQQRLIKMITELAQYCKTSDGQLNVHQHQDLVRDFKIHEHIIQLLRIPRSNKDNQELSALFSACFDFLTAMCNENDINQQILWTHRNLFLQHVNLNQAIQLLIAIVSKNVVIGCAVKEDDVLKIVQLIVQEGYNHLFLKLLAAIVSIKIRGKPLFAQQRMVVKALLAHKEALVLLNSQDSEKSKISEILDLTDEVETKTSQKAPESALFTYHIELIDLLSLCAEENYEIKILCRTILSFEELVDKLTQSNIELNKKAPFIRLINQVYVIALAEDTQTEKESLFPPKVLSRLFKALLKDLQHIKEVDDVLETEQYVFESVMPLAENFFTMHNEYLKQFLITENEFGTLYELESILSTTFIGSEFKPEHRGLGLRCVRLLSNVLINVMLTELKFPAKIQEEFNVNSEALHQANLVDMILANNKHMNAKTAAEYASKISELAIGHHKIILQDTVKKKDRQRKTKPPEENITIDSASAEKQSKVTFAESVEVKRQTKATDIDLELQDINNEEYIKSSLNKFTQEFCTEQGLQEELDILAVTLLKLNDMDCLEKLMKLLGDPVVIKQTRFEDTFVIALRVLQRIVVKHKMGEELCRRGAMRMVVRLISHSSGIIMEEALKVALALVQGGNEVAQFHILDYIQHSIGEDNFFGSIHILINQFTQELKQRQILESGKALTKSKEYHSVEFAKQLFLFLQMLCEGNHHKKTTPNYTLQHLLRFQGANINYNILGELWNYFCALDLRLNIHDLSEVRDSNINQHSIDLSRQLLSTITEIVSGPNEENQRCLIETNRFFGPLNKILGIPLKGLIDKCTLDPVTVQCILNIKEDVIALLLAFLEGQKDPFIFSHIITNINMSNLQATLKTFYPLMKSKQERQRIPSATYKAMRSMVLYCYILIKTLIDYDASNKISKELTTHQWFIQLSDLLRNRYVGNIEIVRNETLEKVYFKVPELVTTMWHNNTEIKQLKQSITFSVNRENDYERIEDFFDKSQDLMFIMKLNWNLQQGSQEHDSEQKKDNNTASTTTIKIGNKIGTKYKWFEDCTYYLSIIINFLILISYSSSYFPESRTPVFSGFSVSTGFRVAILAFGITHLFFSVLRLAGYYITRGPVKVERRKREIAKLNNNTAQDDNDLPIKKKRGCQAPVSGPLSAAYNTWQIFSTGISLYLVVYLVFSILGLIFPFAYAFHMLDTLIRFRLLRSLLHMVFKKNLSMLAQTALIGLVLIYIYSVLGFWLFRYDYTPDHEQYYCSSLLECFLFHLNKGLAAGGGIGELTQQIPYVKGSYGTYAGKLIFDLTFFLLIIVILLSIVSGIIIDSFGAIRDQLTAIVDDMKSKCFICSIDNTLFERHADGFLKHTRNDHHMWTYLFFMCYLDLKEKHTYTAQESYIDDMMQQRDLSFFPIGRALCLTKSAKNK